MYQKNHSCKYHSTALVPLCFNTFIANVNLFLVPPSFRLPLPFAPCPLKGVLSLSAHKQVQVIGTSPFDPSLLRIFCRLLKFNLCETQRLPLRTSARNIFHENLSSYNNQLIVRRQFFVVKRYEIQEFNHGEHGDTRRGKERNENGFNLCDPL